MKLNNIAIIREYNVAPLSISKVAIKLQKITIDETEA